MHHTSSGEEEQKVSSHKRRTCAEVQELVAAFISSGMRRSEFCRSRRLIFGTLNRRLKEQRLQRKIQAASSAGRLVPVELAPRKLPIQFHNFLRFFTAV